MQLSDYKLSNTTEIQQLFTRVFSDSEGLEEGERIGTLVQDMINDTAPEDIFGYIASEQERVIGCIFCTRLFFDSPIEAFILAPVAISTNQQGKGVGQALINYGIGELKDKGIKLLLTYGDPNYYSQVGFQQITEAVIKAPQPLSQPEGWLCQTLDGSEITPIPGNSACVKALDNPVYW